MYCLKCGKPDQTPESFCRQCGTLLPDPDKLTNTRVSPNQHLTANIVLSSMTTIISFTLAALLYYFDLGWPEGSVLTYATAGFLIAIGCWNIQTLWRSILLKKYFRENSVRAFGDVRGIEGRDTNRSLDAADFELFRPASVTDHSTRDLVQERRRSS